MKTGSAFQERRGAERYYPGKVPGYIWNWTIANKARGIRTWIYIDDLYVLTQPENCARFLMYMWKQFPKYGGVPTGITQNIEDLWMNRELRGIINNSPFFDAESAC